MKGKRTIEPLLRQALAEDRARADVTSRALLGPKTTIRAAIIAKASGILAGGAIAAHTFRLVDPSLRCIVHLRDGARLRPGQRILSIWGRARPIFAAERTALNVLAHLCGIATLTHRYVQRVRPSRAQILDTRKTLPGLRALQKYAVRVGGGRNHRSDLAAAILIKTNHLRAAQCGMRNAECGITIKDAITKARCVRPKRFVEVEVTNLQEFRAALEARPDAILLDNWTLPSVRRTVLLRKSALRTLHSAPLLEVSGGVNLGNVRQFAKAGVDRLSIGRLTHSVHALDVSLRVR